MGTWGAGPYQDDTAWDFRDSYISYLKEGLSDTADVPGLYADSGKNHHVGFLAIEPRSSPLDRLVRTQVVLPKPPKYDGAGFCLGREKMTELVAAGLG